MITAQKALYRFENELQLDYQEPDIEIKTEEPEVMIDTNHELEIKTECFEFGSLVAQSWITSIEGQPTEDEPDDVSKEESPALEEMFPDSEVKGKQMQNVADKVRDSGQRICPYCGDILTASGIVHHVSFIF